MLLQHTTQVVTAVTGSPDTSLLPVSIGHQTVCHSLPRISASTFTGISHYRFNEIYSAAAHSGEFGLNPVESLYQEVHPEGPTRPGRHQDGKIPPLRLKMAGVFSAFCDR